MHLTLDALRTLLAFVAVLGVLIFVHEMGHYLAARWQGIHVDAFSIGFGRALLRWTDRRGTEWKLAWIPLGGYVKLHGQERPEDVPSDVRAAWRPGQTFHGKSVLGRAIVVAGGPAANFLLAAVVFAALFATVGRPMSRPVVTDVLPDSAAAAAGLQAGDRVLDIDGQPVRRFEDIQRAVMMYPGRQMLLRVQRGDAQLDRPVTVGTRTLPDGARVGLLGIRGGASESVRLDPVSALGAGVGETWSVTRQTIVGVGEMISGHRGTEELGGPLRIAQLSGEVAQNGFASLVGFIALLSVNLGLINLFPIPILDGGHLLFFLFEAIRGRPLPPRAQEYGLRAGIAVLACLFVLTTWNDLGHLGLFSWVRRLAG